MANENRGRILNFIQHNIAGAVAIIVILMLVIPLPKFMIDIFMILNLSLSVVILLVVLSTPRPSSFTSYPRVVLFATLFGLGINISSTRLILSSPVRSGGYSDSQSAMVQAFAGIVTGGGNIVVGLVIFIILIVIQVLVITKGSDRVSEVAARFTLDAMQTKQLDIDTQLSNGYITEEEAKLQKEELRRDIDFYSNMDGSTKFVSGNVKAGIFITVVNLVGGFIVGMVQNNLDFSSALEVYSNLTIGDGLLSQLPSLMLSFATGLLVTGDKADELLSDKVKSEFTTDGNIYMLVGGALIVMGIALRSHTQFLLIPVGAFFVFIGYRLSQTNKVKKEKKLAQEAAAASDVKSISNPEKDAVAPLDPLSLELGYTLLPLVEKDKGAELLERVSRIRRECAIDLGLTVPKIRIMDNMNLSPEEYSVKIRGIEAGKAKIRMGYYLCMNTGTVTQELQGEMTHDPAFGLPAIWLPEEKRLDAEQAGYAVVDSPTVIATHLTQIIRSHADEILGREEVKLIIDSVKETNPIVVEEVLNGEKTKFSYGEIEKILQGLLREQVSIRNMVTILETLANYGAITKNTWDLIEKVREALGKQICLQYVDDDKKIRIINLSIDWAQKIKDHAVYYNDGSRPEVSLDPVDTRRFIQSVSEAAQQVGAMGFSPIIYCSATIRNLVKSAVEIELPGIAVISDRELLSAGRAVVPEILTNIEYEG